MSAILMIKEKKAIQAATEFDQETEVDGRTIHGYFAKWNLDRVGDTILPGAFKRTIEEKGPRRNSSGRWRSKIKIDFNHKEIVGVPREIDEDPKGAWYKAVIDNTPAGDIVLARIKSGSLDYNSFTYRVVDKDDKNEVVDGRLWRRQLKELEVFEVGPVDDPANDTAEILGFKHFLDVSGWEPLLHEVRNGRKIAKKELGKYLTAHKALSELIVLAGATLPKYEADAPTSAQKQSLKSENELKDLLRTLKETNAAVLKGTL